MENEGWMPNKRDLDTIRIALNCAIDERDGYADAYNNKGPDAKRAIALVTRFEKLHVKMFGCETARKTMHREMAAMSRINIHELGLPPPPEQPQ